MKKEQFIKTIIGLFADASGCRIQYNNCPCNTCFHSIEKVVDFQHICWLILLGLRGDYKGKSQQHILKGIKKELEKY